MKLIWFSFGFLVLVATSGCVHSHRGREVVYYTAPAPAAPPVPVVTVAPPPTSVTVEPPPTSVIVSPVPTSRVVSPDEVIEPPSEPPPGVSSQDLAIAESISKLLKNDAHMASISGNVQTTVDRGVVILRGTVPSENAMDEIALRVSKVPGVHHIEDHLDVSNR